MKDLQDLQGPQPDPYFSYRVQALLAERQQQKKILFWKIFSGLSTTVAVLALYMNFQVSRVHQNSLFTSAPVNRAMVIQLDQVPDLPRIMYVSLEIDEGMIFDLGDATLSQKKEITLALEQGQTLSKRLPFVIKALTSGLKTVRIKFLDADLNVVKEETQHLRFFDLKG